MIFKMIFLFIYFNKIDIANLANQYQSELLTADDDAKYDRIIDINLSEVKQHLYEKKERVFYFLISF